MQRMRTVTLLATAILAGAEMLTAAHAANPSCFGEPATIVGTQGNDSLNGTLGSDVIVARGGNDLIAAKSGADLICGG